VANCDKKFVFKGESDNETHVWGKLILKAVEKSDGWKKNYSYLAKYPRFWRVYNYLIRKTTKVKYNSETMHRAEI